MSRNRRVLLIEDDPDVADFLAAILMQSGCHVIVAGNVEDALITVETTDLDFVMTDIFMPGMGGIAGIPVIKKLKPDLPVVAISGGWRDLDSEKTILAARKIGADFGIAKPFAPDDFNDLLAQLER